MAIAGDKVGYFERLAARAVQRDVVAVAAGNRACTVHNFGAKHTADHLQLAARGGENAGSEADVDRQLRAVLRGDQQSACSHELLEVFDTVGTKAGADIVGGIDLAEVGGELGRLPRHRIAPHRQAVDDHLCTRLAYRPKQDHVVFAAQVADARGVLGADVVVFHAELIQRHAPPAFGLGV